MKFKTFLLVVPFGIMISACGPLPVGGNANGLGQVRPSPIPVSPLAPAPQDNQAPNAPLSIIPQQQIDALMGTYTGSLNKFADDGINVVTQSFTLVLTKTQPDAYQRTYAYMFFQTSGVLGNFSKQSEMNIGVNGWGFNYGMSTSSFASKVLSIPELTPWTFDIEMVVSLDSTNKFVPTQSAIFLKDCGFSQGIACINPLQDVWFGNDFGKR